MKIMISAGEASGDMHAAVALKQLMEMSPDSVEAFGMGGSRLAGCGMELLVDARNHAVMGLVEVLHKYPQLRANLQSLKKAIRERKPDVIVLVDYPHFNMKLATEAKALGVPVLYYIAPKVWASRAGRIQELAETIDKMAVIFPFEVNIFKQAGISTRYVGNPVLENTALMEASQHSAASDNLVALLPGSRKNEINHLLPPMIEAAQLLTQKHANLRFVIPVAETIDPQLINNSVSASNLDIELIDANDFVRLKQCRAALVSSGTATLELAVLGVPMVVAYKMNTLSYRVLRRWLTIENVSLVNIIAERALVPELLQDDANAVRLFEEILPLIGSDEQRNLQISGFETIHEKLVRPDRQTSLASMMLSYSNQEQHKREREAV